MKMTFSKIVLVVHLILLVTFFAKQRSAKKREPIFMREVSFDSEFLDKEST